LLLSIGELSRVMSFITNRSDESAPQL